MINVGETCCPKCGGELKEYDRVKRILRSKGRSTKWITIRRMQCVQCKSVHRELPKEVLPFKQYEKEIIFGVVEGFITSDTLGYEDYPCEMTMSRWHAKFASSVMKSDLGGESIWKQMQKNT